VVADAVYGEPAQRREIETVARTAGRAFTGFWLEAPEGQLFDRLAQRRADASDANVAVLRHQLATITPPCSWARLDAGNTPADCASRVDKILNAGANLDVAQV
jgi:hypothetical protein